MINANYGCGKSVSREVERNQRKTARRGPFLIASSRQSKHSRRAVAPNIPAPTPHAAAGERRSGRGPKHTLRDSIDSIRQSTHNEDRATPRLLHAWAVAGPRVPQFVRLLFAEQARIRLRLPVKAFSPCHLRMNLLHVITQKQAIGCARIRLKCWFYPMSSRM